MKMETISEPLCSRREKDTDLKSFEAMSRSVMVMREAFRSVNNTSVRDNQEREMECTKEKKKTHQMAVAQFL